jgi:hypothetical protein
MPTPRVDCSTCVHLPTPLVVRRNSGVPTPQPNLRPDPYEVNGAAVLTGPPIGLVVRCYNRPPAGGESALFL